MDEKPPVGSVIRKLRRDREWSLRELSERAGLSLNGLHLIEKGRRDPSSSTVANIAEALGVDPGDLYASPKVLGPPPKTYEELLTRAGAYGSGLERPVGRDTEGHIEELFEGLTYREAYDLYQRIAEAQRSVDELVESYRNQDIPQSEKEKLDRLRGLTRYRSMVAWGATYEVLEEEYVQARMRDDANAIAELEDLRLQIAPG